LGQKIKKEKVAMENKVYVCRKLYLYNFLTNKGFKPFKVCPDKWNCEKLVWLYANSADIQKAVEEYYSMDY
jgi:hypothetical protein